MSYIISHCQTEEKRKKYPKALAENELSTKGKTIRNAILKIPTKLTAKK